MHSTCIPLCTQILHCCVLCMQSFAVFAEAPEEVVDTRSLYDQLQAQKEAKQLEYEEQHRLSACSFFLLPPEC